jgi:hypothetical protein
MRRAEHADSAEALPAFCVSDVQPINGGSLQARFKLRIIDDYGRTYLCCRGTKYFIGKDGRKWVEVSHRDDRGTWEKDVSFAGDFGAAIVERVVAELESMPPPRSRDTSRPHTPTQRTTATPHRASTTTANTNAQRRDALYARGDAGLQSAFDDGDL